MKKALFVTWMVLMEIFMCNDCIAQIDEYKVNQRSDGGYAIDIKYTVQSWLPITAEGPFPRQVKKTTVELIGKGKDWSYRNQNGYYYDKNDIRGILGEIAYAWIDHKREYIYLNFFWISSPNKLTPSVINGKYRILSK